MTTIALTLPYRCTDERDPRIPADCTVEHTSTCDLRSAGFSCEGGCAIVRPDEDCEHPGLFADDGPLDRTHTCRTCNTEVPNRDL